MCEFLHDYVKPKYSDYRAFHCISLCIDTEYFVVYIITDDIDKDIAEDTGTRIDS